ncbi:MAG: hypothetical protein H7239_05890 [Flavobacterium sp.]|nr:hypothetical protein [Flavobacterium sp.]
MKKLILLILLVTIYTSCKREALKPSYLGTKFNLERRTIGLRIIDSTMNEIYGNGYDKINKMFNPINLSSKGINISYGLKKPSFFHKSIFLDPKNGKLIFEEDVYVNGKIKITVDDFVNETIIYRYVFKEYNDIAGLSSSYSFIDYIKIKKGWQYIHVYPVPADNKINGIQFYVQKLDYVSKQTADSLLNIWKIKRLNY